MNLRDRVLIWLAGRVLTLCTAATRRRLTAALRPSRKPITNDEC